MSESLLMFDVSYLMRDSILTLCFFLCFLKRLFNNSRCPSNEWGAKSESNHLIGRKCSVIASLSAYGLMLGHCVCRHVCLCEKLLVACFTLDRSLAVLIKKFDPYSTSLHYVISRADLLLKSSDFCHPLLSFRILGP